MFVSEQIFLVKIDPCNLYSKRQMLRNCLLLFFIHVHLKLELLTQFPASNEGKIFIFMKNSNLKY